MSDTTVIVDYNTFIEYFPELYSTTETQVNNAYQRSIIYINPTYLPQTLKNDLRVQAVYLATAHIIAMNVKNLANNGSVAGIVNSAGQGSESVGLQAQPTKNMLDYNLGQTSYGLQLLAILELVMPLFPEKKTKTYPYYNAGGINVIGNS